MDKICRCKFQQGVDKLVSVGDLVNKGEQSAEVYMDPDTNLKLGIHGCFISSVAIASCSGQYPGQLTSTMEWQAVHLVRQYGGITVRGNHDEMALERYEMWKKCGRLDVYLLPHAAQTCLHVLVLKKKNFFHTACASQNT